MARKQQHRLPAQGDEFEDDEIDISDEAPDIDPYAVLSIEKNATSDQIKSAYRRQALKHHPDKAAEADKSAAHIKFQEIAFAYAVLGDDKRRKRYDATGRTDESIEEDGDFDWKTFYQEQFEDAISTDKIEAFAKEYKHSDEEKQDVLAAYEEVKGDMAELYEYVMLSDPQEDEDRFRTIIDAAIANDEVSAYQKYSGESAKQRKQRIKSAKKAAGKEAVEAEEMAKELGLKGKKGKKDADMSDLAALIKQRQKGREELFFDNLEAKYGGGGGKKRSRADEPPEEAFRKNEKKSKKSQNALRR